MNLHPALRISALCTLLLLASAPARAGGYKIPDQSTRALGMMDAFIAGADDASAVYYNPAGLAALKSPEIIGNLYLSHAELEWDSDLVPDEESEEKYYLIPTVYGAYPLPGREDLVLGLGIYSPYGLGTEWDRDDAPVNAALASFGEIVVVNLTPSVAWRFSEKLRLGAGLDFAWSSVEQQRQGPPRTSMDGDGTGLGYNLGLQYDITPAVTLGLRYRSAMTIDYSGDATVQGVYRGGADTEIEFPSSAALALSVQASPCLRFEAAAEWQDWSVNDKTVVEFDAPFPPSVTPNDWDSSWLYMLGVEYDVSRRMTLRAGYGYNEQPIPPETATPSMPQDDLHAVSLGMGYAINEHWTVDSALLVSRSEDEQSIGATPGGEYSHVGYAVSLGLRYAF